MGVHHTRRCRNADGDDGGAPVYGSVRCPDECFDGAGPYDDQLCDGCQPVRLGRGAAFDRGACGPLWSRKGPGGRCADFCAGQRSYTRSGDEFRTRADDRTVIGSWGGRGQLLGIDRGGITSRPSHTSWHGGGCDQRWQLIWTVCFRPLATGVDLSVRLDGGDVVVGDYHAGDTPTRAFYPGIPDVFRWDGWRRYQRAVGSCQRCARRSQLLAVARRLRYLRLPHRFSRHASPGRSGFVWFAGIGGELVVGNHWYCHHRRQPGGWLVCEPLSEQVCAILDVRLACVAGVAISRRSQDRLDFLSLCGWARFYLAGHRASNGGRYRQIVWNALPRNALWACSAVAPDR